MELSKFGLCCASLMSVYGHKLHRGGLTGGDSPAAPEQPCAFDVTPETDASSLEGGAERGVSSFTPSVSILSRLKKMSNSTCHTSPP